MSTAPGVDRIGAPGHTAGPTPSAPGSFGTAVDPVLAEVVRSGFTESVHRGRVVALAADGSTLLAVGDVDAPVFARSSVKPFQALAMLGCGLPSRGELLALAAASHSGEPFHLDGVRRVLARSGLDESALGCPPDVPIDEGARTAWIRDGHGPERVAMNCSGKHSAMLATCVAAGWSTDDYLDPAHPLQQAVAATLERFAGGVAAVGVDGCGAPLFATSLRGLAAAGRALVTGDAGPDGLAVAQAYRDHPEWTSGTTRAEAALMRAVPGLVVKGGAEGVQLAMAPDGRALAVKVDDGAGRASVPVLVAALRAVGVEVPAEPGPLLDPPVLGGGRPVGALRVPAGVLAVGAGSR